MVEVVDGGNISGVTITAPKLTLPIKRFTYFDGTVDGGRLPVVNINAAAPKVTLKDPELTYGDYGYDEGRPGRTITKMRLKKEVK